MRLRKIVKEKRIYTKFLLQLVQSCKTILFWNFRLEKGKKSCLKTPFAENRNVFGWVLKANFHVLMPFLWTQRVFMPKYGINCVNKWKNWFCVKTPQKSKILKNSRVCRRFFLGSKKSEWFHILFICTFKESKESGVCV